ncbi:MAG TPA: hypothetical protein VFC38_11215 [Stellaceae bacterium]|nr:hypothetical protein [Stellaceae bacterium]
MESLVGFAKISDVQFGTPGTIALVGTDFADQKITVTIPLTDVSNLIPRLLQAATVALYAAPPLPTNGTSIPIVLVPVLDGHSFAARDTQEPGLTLHTPGGTLQFHFPPGLAVRCGKGLDALGAASSSPDPAKMN